MAALCLRSLFGAGAALAQAESLSFDTALDLAAKISPELAGQAADLEAAQSSSVAAGALPDPWFVAGIDNLPVDGEDAWSLDRDFMTMQKIGFMQEVPNGDRRRAQTAAAQAAVTQAEAGQRVRAVVVRREAAAAWINRYYVERSLALIADLDRENQLFAQAMQAALAGGRGLPADVVAPKQEAAELADRRDDLTAGVARAKAALRRFVGAEGDLPLAGDVPAMTLDAEHLRAHVHQHPELVAFMPMVEMAQAQIHEAEAMKKPDWGVELMYARRPEFSDMVSMQFTFGLPLFAGSRQDPQIAAKRHELARIEAERETMLRDHIAELDADLAEYQGLTRQLERFNHTRLPLAQEKVELQFASYRAGKVDLGTVLAARRELIDERLKLIELQSRRSLLMARVYFAYGEGAR